MKQYQTFTFDGYSFDTASGAVELRYSLDDELTFVERLTLPLPTSTASINQASLDASLFALHLIGGISYYKTCLPKKIVIRSGTLSRAQAEWWNEVYEQGLGEFFFRNAIDGRNLISFPSSSEANVPKPLTTDRGASDNSLPRCLVPIGGGKDSIVTIETLKRGGFPVTLVRMEPHPIIDTLAAIAGLPVLTVTRTLDPLLFRLIADGASNGHIPISAYLSFLTITLSLLHGFDAVVMSNERSATIGNVEYLGSTINHQWSKGIQFERMLQQYCATYLAPHLQHFSLLRPLSELHVGKLFAKYPAYHQHFTSCNANWKILKEKTPDRWCKKCPKCAFVFAILAAFVPRASLREIFGSILFEDESLAPLYRQLLSIEGFKPFECVGTPEETLAAFALAHERGELQETPIMRMAMNEASLPDDVHELITAQFTPSTDHLIPPIFRPLLNL